MEKSACFQGKLAIFTGINISPKPKQCIENKGYLPKCPYICMMWFPKNSISLRIPANMHQYLGWRLSRDTTSLHPDLQRSHSLEGRWSHLEHGRRRTWRVDLENEISPPWNKPKKWHAIESWLFNRDPYNGLWNNPHITEYYFIPFKKLNQPGALFHGREGSLARCSLMMINPYLYSGKWLVGWMFHLFSNLFLKSWNVSVRTVFSNLPWFFFQIILSDWSNFPIQFLLRIRSKMSKISHVHPRLDFFSEAPQTHEKKQQQNRRFRRLV